MRVGIVMVGIGATFMALTIQSIYALWYLCADLVYVILFPQLLCVVYFKRSNTYGCLLGYGGGFERAQHVDRLLTGGRFVVGMLLRLSGGEPLLHLPSFVQYPMYDAATGVQYFPFKTMSMLISLGCCVSGALCSEWLFRSGILQPELDLLNCVVNVSAEHAVLPSDTSFNVSSSSEMLVMQKLRPPADGGASQQQRASHLAPPGAGAPSTEHSALTANGAANCHHDYMSVDRA